MRTWRTWMASAGLAGLAALLPLRAPAEQIALVIGMAAYQHMSGLKNTLNDARLIGTELDRAGVDVTVSYDATREELLATLADFAFRAEAADLAMIYFAGHGVEVQGQNFLIPVDADVRSNADVARQAVSLDQFLDSVSGARVMRVVVLDACRDNPFGDLVDMGGTLSGASSSSQPERGVGGAGLAPVSPDRGTLVAFAASEGQVSYDGGGGNSPYAMALANALGTPGLEIGLMFRQVRDEVLAETGNHQEPYTYGSLSATPFYLGGAGAPPATASTDELVTAWAEVPPPQRQEFAALAETGDTRSMLALGYMRLNPASPDYDLPGAVTYLRSAADEGSPEAMFELSRLYTNGRGVTADQEKALELLQQAAALGEPRALNNLGYYYYNGDGGLPEDRVRAIDFIGRAADLEEPSAIYNYAALIDDGLVAGKGPRDAGAYLYRAIRSGNDRVARALAATPEMFKPETRQALQEELRRHGFYEGIIDGSLGPRSREAMGLALGRPV